MRSSKVVDWLFSSELTLECLLAAASDAGTGTGAGVDAGAESEAVSILGKEERLVFGRSSAMTAPTLLSGRTKRRKVEVTNGMSETGVGDMMMSWEHSESCVRGGLCEVKVEQDMAERGQDLTGSS